MAKRMLIDAAHPEETRVVVTSGTRLEEFDFESSTKRQVKGNIYLAKVTRVEPSLQAAFVDYGGNRHGFLAFSEIHPDYYRVPVSDRPQPHAEHAAANEHDHDPAEREADAPDDDGVALAAALPEPVAVPESASEDDALDVQAVERDAVSRSEADTATDEPQAARDLHATEKDTTIDLSSGQEQIGHESDDAPPVAPREVHTSAEIAVSADAGESPQPGDSDAAPPSIAMAERAAPPVATDAPAANFDTSTTPDDAPPVPDRDPGTIALRAAEESLVVAEVVEVDRDGVVPPSEAPSDAPTFIEQVSPNGGTVSAEPYTEQGDPAENGSADAAAFASPDTAADLEGNGVGAVETFGGDEAEEVEEVEEERRRTQPMRHYKIQEVIKRRQIMLVQVAKEERGNKGAALTTYLSLAGRYCVLMPNTNRGGGVSRKITSIADRRRLKDILEELDIPEGMGVIVRTAGAERSKTEIKRDYEYLLRLWNEIRDLTLQSTAPALIYEEGNLIKRSIRDLYARDIDEVLVEGEEGYRTAKAFMRTLMPSHAKRVQPYRDPQIGLFHRFQIESQIDAIHSPVAQLRSGGYVVINQTEALVAIDVNSGRSTRERNIEETALRTNLEAAEEISRQLRLRDLAGLIVIDFIDMEEHRNQIAVERRLKDALKNDRARIQVGRISPFGLLEMSRQRLRPSLAEASTQPCPHCAGTGFIRSVESTALYVLRSIEEEGIRRRSAEICIYVPTTVALYILNQKRESLAQIETRYALRVMVARDDALIPPAFRLERLRAYGAGEALPPRPIQAPIVAEEEPEDEDNEAEIEVAAEAEETAADQAASDDERARRRRRRRRRRGDEVTRDGRPASSPAADADGDTVVAVATEQETGTPRPVETEVARDGDGDADSRRRRRGRRGTRSRMRRENGADTGLGVVAAGEAVELVAATEGENLPTLETWPAEPGLEIADPIPLAGTATEVAPADEAAQEQVEREPAETADAAPAEAPLAEAQQGVPFVGETERVFEETPALAPATAPFAETPHEPAPQFEPLGATAGIPEPVHREPQPELALAAGAPESNGGSRPVEEVLTVTEKPANPRRGWWQRLTQP